jgi:hypothetical protein
MQALWGPRLVEIDDWDLGGRKVSRRLASPFQTPAGVMGLWAAVRRSEPAISIRDGGINAV